MTKNSLLVNTRCLQRPTTGVQRYTQEILRQLPETVETIAPAKGLIKGHLWEQLLLPKMIGSRLLWSPANTGPIAVRNQVLTVHDIAPVDHPQWFSRKFALLYKCLWPNLLPRVRGILTDSHFTKERIIKKFGINSENIHVVHLGVDERFFSALPKIPENLVKSVGNMPFVLAVGSIDPRKNLLGLLDAWDVARKQLGEHWRLVLVGDPNPRVFSGTIQSQKQEQVVWAGRVSDEELPNLYAAASLFIYPSFYEGFGLPVLEAMAAGTPVIASNVASIPEVVGSAGRLCDPYSIKDISDSILHVATNEKVKADYISLGKQNAASFSWKDTANLVNSILHNYY